MVRSIRNGTVWLVGTAASVLLLTACSGTSHPTSTSSDCSWPHSASAASQAALFLDQGSVTGSSHFLLFDPADGHLLGSCAVTGLINQPPQVSDGSSDRSQNGPVVSQQPVGPAPISMVPDNVVTGGEDPAVVHGAVRFVPSGGTQPLSFDGWAVASTLGSSLLLEQLPPAPASSSAFPAYQPAAWCLLPSVTAALDACEPIHATSQGTPVIGTHGAVTWVPQRGYPENLAGVPGLLSAAGTSIGAFRRTSNAYPLPVTVDSDAIVIEPGQSTGDASTELRWATITSAPTGAAAPRFTVHTNPGPVDLATDTASYQIVDGGSGVIRTTTGCDVYRIGSTGRPAMIAQLKPPRSVSCGRLIHWPTPSQSP